MTKSATLPNWRGVSIAPGVRSMRGFAVYLFENQKQNTHAGCRLFVFRGLVMMTR